MLFLTFRKRPSFKKYDWGNHALFMNKKLTKAIYNMTQLKHIEELSLKKKTVKHFLQIVVVCVCVCVCGVCVCVHVCMTLYTA